ncbi:DUF2007 domain-containing protein [Vibrio cidicii]|uniref:putative signal transducing protein n=1 Tax=Vibrio cidicii TaxID=1763883 RepID=UPI0009EE524C|nr:DUF2007 domain-containing protein [Vibrio cidicii]
MRVFTANSPVEAHIVCQLLRSENIECEIRGENLFGLKGELPATSESDPYIWIHEPQQYQAAMKIVSQYLHQSCVSTYWCCSNCGEENEGQFALCWCCGEPDTSS